MSRVDSVHACVCVRVYALALRNRGNSTNRARALGVALKSLVHGRVYRIIFA